MTGRPVSNVPDRPGGEDPFEGLPPELRAMFEQLGGPEGLAAAQEQLTNLLGGMGGPGGLGGIARCSAGSVHRPARWTGTSPPAWRCRSPPRVTAPPPEEERERAEQALALAEHWLDATTLPAPPDAGRLVVGSRQEWVNLAIPALRPLVEPVARAATDALIDLAREQFGELGERPRRGWRAAGGPRARGPPARLADLLGQLLGGRPRRPAAPGRRRRRRAAGRPGDRAARPPAVRAYDLGIPTAPRAEAHLLPVNVAEAFDGYELDPTEVAIVLALGEAAHRRLYHAVPWLEAHVQSLVARFAAGTTVDEQRLRELSDDLMVGVDPEDPEALRAAMERAAQVRLEPTAEQQRVLERLQGVVCLVGAWARHEVARAVEGRLPASAGSRRSCAGGAPPAATARSCSRRCSGSTSSPTTSRSASGSSRPWTRRSARRGCGVPSTTRRTCPTRRSSPSRAAGSPGSVTSSMSPTTPRRCSTTSARHRTRAPRRSAGGSARTGEDDPGGQDGAGPTARRAASPPPADASGVAAASRPAAKPSR
jgi:hypothetical protein